MELLVEDPCEYYTYTMLFFYIFFTSKILEISQMSISVSLHKLWNINITKYYSVIKKNKGALFILLI